MEKKTLTIHNPSGLHMRPAGLFVKTVQPFQSEVTIAIRDKTHNAKSMFGILGAGIKCGDAIEVTVTGDDEAACMEAITAAVESGLGE